MPIAFPFDNNVYCYVEPPPLTSLWAILHCIGNMKVDLLWEVILYFLPVTFLPLQYLLPLVESTELHMCMCTLTCTNLCLYRPVKINHRLVHLFMH